MSEHYCDYQMPAAVRPVSDVEEALDMLKAAEAGAARLREALVAARKVIERLGAGPENDTAPDFDWLLDVSEDGLALADAALADDAGRALLDELAGLRAKVAQLESNIDRSVCLDADGERIHFGARVVCGQCFGSQGQHLKNARAERDALNAQLADAEKLVEFSREFIQWLDDDGEWPLVLAPARDALAAYDAKWRAGK